MAVNPPFEILDLRPEGELVTRVAGVEEGPVTITPRDGRPPKTVPGVRIHVPPADKQTSPPWWDATSQTLRPTLLACAAIAQRGGRWVRIHKFGSGAGARFSCEVLPAEFTGPARADVTQATGAGP